MIPLRHFLNIISSLYVIVSVKYYVTVVINNNYSRFVLLLDLSWNIIYRKMALCQDAWDELDFVVIF